MPQEPLAPQAKAGVLLELIRNARLVWRLLKDKRVAIWAKAIVPATIVYLILPVDLMPDVLLGLGQLDDLAIVLLGCKVFIDLCPPEIVKEQLADIVGINMPRQPDPTAGRKQAGYIDGQYRVLDDPQQDKDQAP